MCRLLKKDKTFKISDGFQPTDLLKYASDHLASAKLLFETNPLCYDSAGYLAHLGLELILKSILLNLNGEFPAEHNLEILYNLAKKAGAHLLERKEEKALAKISQFFYLRYVNPQNPIEIGDDDWKMIEKIFFSLLTNFPNNIMSEIHNSNYYEKGSRILFRKTKGTHKLTGQSNRYAKNK